MRLLSLFRLLPATFMHMSKAAFKSGREARGKLSGEKDSQPEAAEPSVRGLSQAVAQAVRAGDRRRAERLLEQMLQKKLPVDTMPFNSAPQSFFTHGSLQEIYIYI